MSLNASLESLNRSSDSVKSLYFTPSGVFTNALTLKPYITKLIRDAADYESAMYTISKDTKEPHRVDGSRSYLDFDEDDEDASDTRQQQQPTVKIPSLNKNFDQVVEKEDSKIQLMLNDLNNEDYSVGEMIETLDKIIDNDQSVLSNHSEIKESLNDRRVNFEKLNEELKQLESIVQQQKDQLNAANSNINDKHILNSDDGGEDDGKRKLYAKDLIAREEEEIRNLERLLTNKKREDKHIRDSIVNE